MATEAQTPTERELSLDEPLRSVLCAIRNRLAADPVARIERGRLRRAEVTLDEIFPDDLIAAWAVLAPVARSVKQLEGQFSPEGAVAATAHLGEMGYEDAAEGYIALCITDTEGQYDCWANASSSPLKARRREGGAPTGTRVLTMEFAEDIPARVVGRTLGLAAWLRKRYAVEEGAEETVPAAFAEAFRVVVLEPPAAKIRHAKFGEGELLEDLGDRAVVRFADGRTRKLLKSSFVS